MKTTFADSVLAAVGGAEGLGKAIKAELDKSDDTVGGSDRVKLLLALLDIGDKSEARR